MLIKLLKPAADRCLTNIRAFIIPNKVNAIVKANANSLKTLVSMLIIEGEEKQKK